MIWTAMFLESTEAQLPARIGFLVGASRDDTAATAAKFARTSEVRIEVRLGFRLHGQ